MQTSRSAPNEDIEACTKWKHPGLIPRLISSVDPQVYIKRRHPGLYKMETFRPLSHAYPDRFPISEGGQSLNLKSRMHVVLRPRVAICIQGTVHCIRKYYTDLPA